MTGSWTPLWPMIEPLVRQAQPDRFRWPRPKTNGWIGPICSPLREDRSPSFSVLPDSENDPGAYRDHATDDKGSMADLARRLGLDLEQSRQSGEPGRSAQSGRSAKPDAELTLEQFCERRKLDPNRLRGTWQVRQVKHQGRPALRYPTRLSVDRIKFLDGDKPKATWGGRGGRAHAYGLGTARQRGGDVLYIVNGEPSVWAAAQSGVPAVCTCCGEDHAAEDFVEELQGLRFERMKVVYDRDDAGHRGARTLVQSLRDAGFEATALELPAELGPGGDVDDLHRRVGDAQLAEALAALPELSADQSPVGTVAPNVSALSDPVWPEALGAEAYHGPVGEFVRLVEPHTEADPAALLVQFLAAFGSAVGGGPHFRVGADHHPGRLYVVQVGTSSRGRKGTSWGWVRNVMGEADPTWRDRVVGGLSSGEGVIWAVRDPIEQWKTAKPSKFDPNPEPEFVVTDPGVEDKRLCVIEGEFSSVLRVAERTGNTLSATLRNAWDLGPDQTLQSLVKNNPSQATGAHISIVGHVTAPELKRYLTNTEAGNGYGNRFLWVAVKRSKLLPDGGAPPQQDITAFNAFIASLVDKAKSVGAMDRTADAAALWREVYPVLSRDDTSGLFGAVTARSEAQVTRLSLIYALLDGSPQIGPEHLSAALEVWRYAEDSCQYIFGDSLGDPIADEILRALRAAPNGLTRSEIRNIFSRNVASGRLGAALEALAKAGKATVTTERKDVGRPTERWRVNVSPYAKNAINAINAIRGDA